MSNDRRERDAPPTQAIMTAAADGLAAVALLTLDPSGTITSWNLGAERLFGHTREFAVGHDLSFVVPDDRDGAAARHQLLDQAQSGLPRPVEHRLRHRDGSLRDFTIAASAIPGAGGLTGYVVLIQGSSQTVGAARPADDDLASRLDDAERRFAESTHLLSTATAERRQAEAARLRLLRRLVAAEEEERRRIARDLHDDLGQRLTTLRLALEGLGADSVDATSISDGIRAALAQLAQIDQGLDFLAWDLRPAALDELGLPRVLNDYVAEWSKHTGVRAVFHAGASEAERFAPEVESCVYRIAQEALNNVAKHARAQSVNVLLEQRGDDIVLIVEDDGSGFRAPEGRARMNGLTGMKERAAAVGGTLELEPTPDGGTTVLAFIPASMPPPPVAARDSLDADDGASAGVTVSPFMDDGRHSAVTTLRERLHELQHAVAARDEFIATVAHELRNPVAPLMFQIRLAIDKSEQAAARREEMPDGWVQSQLRRIEHRLHRLLETLDRLLDVSRLSTGRIDLQPEEVNLSHLVRDVVNSFESELAVARCTLTFSASADPTGWWDRLRLEQICRNLLSNAIRFGAGRPITVSVAADSDFASLEVRDQGVGIAPEMHSQIFDRFERGAERRSGGFGIGLWVVKNVCVAMGGTITVDSDLGEGAAFTVMLPRQIGPECSSRQNRAETT